nr:ALPV-326 [Albatrosspox virus]
MKMFRLTTVISNINSLLIALCMYILKTIDIL